MKMKYVILFSAMLLLATVPFLQAQPGRGGRPMQPSADQIPEMVAKLDSVLTLTDEQKAEITQIHEDHFEEMKEMRAERNGDRRQMMESMKAQREKFEENINAVLDEDQQKLYADYVAEQRKNRRGGMMGGRGQRR